MIKDKDQETIERNITKISTFADMLPCVVIIHDLRDWSVAWISKRGRLELGMSLEEITNLSMAEYHSRFFNEQDAKDYAPKVFQLMENNQYDEMAAFFQQVRFTGNTDWTWHLTAMKILDHDASGKPLLAITTAFPIDSQHQMTAKASRLLEENNFLRKNLALFSKLAKRERQVLTSMALGKTALETSNELQISPLTVHTHIKNIRQKLGTTSYYELCEYARAFDLI